MPLGCPDNLPAVAWPLASSLAANLLREHPVRIDPDNAARTLLWVCAEGQPRLATLVLRRMIYLLEPACIVPH